MRENPRRVSEKEQQEKKGTREKAKGRTPSASPATLKKQSSRARRGKRAARWAIRKELPEQMPASRADVKSKAHKLTS